MNRLIPIAFLASIFVAGAGVGVGCGSSSAGSAPQPDSGGAEASPLTDSGGGGTDGGMVEAAPYPAVVPTDIPQVTSRGGSVLPLPKVFPILYANEDPAMAPQITDFVSKVGATQYWKAIVTEYGVGALTGEKAIQLAAADNPPATFDDSEIQTWLAAKLNANDPAFPTPDANTIFAFFFPPGVTITSGGGGGPSPDGGADGGAEGGVADAGSFGGSVGCVDFGGYHSAITLNNNVNVAYAVVPRCASFDGFVGIDAITAAASHELAEGVTDPYIDAFSSVDTAHRYWSTVLGGGEIGDMCAQDLGSFTHFSELSAYLVQRSWSNKAALTGGDPCVPVPQGEVYFNTIPVMPDVLQVMGRAGADGGTSVTPTKGVKIAVGASRTIELDLFSTAPTSKDWNVQVLDSNALGMQSPLLQFSFDKASGHNGDKIQMTIKVLAAGRRNTEAFLIISNMGTSSTSPQNLWAGVVGN